MTKDTQYKVLKVLFHAPTSAALQRARSNATNVRREDPDVDVRIIVNAEAVAPALDEEHPDVDVLTWVCPNTLARINRENRTPLRLLDGAAVLKLARLQQNGWVYIRS